MTARILIVEDEPLIAEDLRHRMEAFGHEVVGSAATADDALRLAESARPDLVLMDIVLKGPMDGIDAAGLIRVRFGTPIVFLSAWADSDTLERAKTAMPYGYLVKPIEDRELKAAVEIALYKAQNEKSAAVRERFEAVGRLAAGVAHNINNLMTVVTGYVTMIRDTLPADDPRRRKIGIVVEAAERAANLSDHLLSYGRRQSLFPRKVALGALLEGLKGRFSEIASGRAAVVVPEGAPEVFVETDARHLGAAIEHLVANAVEAMPGGGSVTVRHRSRAFRPGEAPKGIPIRPGDYGVVEVSDTGCGMAAELAEHAFEPFVSTHLFGRGLGLPSVYGFVRQAGGYVEIRSAPGAGTTVSLYLPIVTPPEAA